MRLCVKDTGKFSKSDPSQSNPEGSKVTKLYTRKREIEEKAQESRAAHLPEPEGTATQSATNARSHGQRSNIALPEQAHLDQTSAAEQTESDAEEASPSPTIQKLSTRSSVRLRKTGKMPAKRNHGYETDVAMADAEGDDGEDVDEDDEEEKEEKEKRQKKRQAALARNVRKAAAAKGASP